MKKNKIFIFFLIFFSSILLVIGATFFYIKNQFLPVSNSKNISEIQKTRIEILDGMTISQTARLLKENNLIKNEKLFYYSIRYPFLLKIFFKINDEKSTFILKSGIYYLSNNMNYLEIQNELSSGHQEHISITFPEGLSITRIGQILEENQICSIENFKKSTQNTKILNKYNILDISSEGYLFPDTYFFNRGTNSDDVVCKMIDNFFEKIKQIPNLQEKSPIELNEIVKLASIVEREYRIKDEAPLIASVFKNRLKRNIGLYSCATIVYIITEIEGRPHPERILISDTKIDSPYNTYKWAGLPPGAISNPGLVALNAVTNTPKTNYYFFQIVDSQNGRHIFTSTFDEHKAGHNLEVKK